MLGKRVELFDSDGYKIRAVHEYSLAGQCPTVTYVPAGGRPAMVEAPVPSGSARPRRVTLHPPELSGGTATFRFDVDPPSPLYHATRFSLTFPPWIDVRGLPDRLWWTVFLLCLHAQWPYLAPCEVRLPIRLGPGEREFWRRLVSSYLDTLEAYRTGETPGRSIELVDEGPLLPPFASMADTGWCATSFSGGKDSLLQVGLLTELTRRPLVVTTTSPLPGLFDHETPWRRHVLSEVGRRRRLTFAEVTSDFRATWVNHYPRQIGYPVSVNETTDTFLYFAALLAVSMALGATHLFLASEAELQESVLRDGRVVRHPHFMYSAATQRAVSAWLGPSGMEYGSLTWPLHSGEVIRLLWSRYPDLASLQYSCWRVRADQAACSRCSQCFRIAVGIMAAGGHPERIGIDVPTVLEGRESWQPSWPAASDALPDDRVRADFSAAIIRSVRATPLARGPGRGGPRRPAPADEAPDLGDHGRVPAASSPTGVLRGSPSGLPGRLSSARRRARQGPTRRDLRQPLPAGAGDVVRRPAGALRGADAMGCRAPRPREMRPAPDERGGCPDRGASVGMPICARGWCRGRSRARP
jgi:hypothetical protein